MTTNKKPIHDAPGRFAYEGLDRVIHEKARLSIITSLATQKLQRLVVDGGRVTHTEEVFKNLGRVRDIKTETPSVAYLTGFLASTGRQ